MIELTLAKIADITGGELLLVEDEQLNNATVINISTDSRSLKKGDVFLALKGNNFDGHKFAEQAQQQQCAAVIVEKSQALDIPQVLVPDTHKALGHLGAYIKAQVNPKTVAITGSSGKTTVKEMTAAILSRLGNVLATKGNFNNEIGVPLTLLRLAPEHDFAVVELGANHIGEIAYTCSLVKPDVSVINNIAAAHLEGFGDLCGVARAKGEIFEGLKEGGVALYNKDSKYASKWQWRLTDKNVKQFSCLNTSDCYSTDVFLNEHGCASFQLVTYKGNCLIELTIPGKHNVCNAVAAAAIALEFGATLDDIRLGLAKMAPVKGRLNHKLVDEKFRLIDDSYNANVESIKAASELLASFPGRRVLVLGDMAELGADARSYHQEVGEHAKHLKIDNLLTLGVLSQATSDAFGDKGQHFDSRAALVQRFAALLHDEQQQIVVLVKGSRSSKMELVAQDIETWRKQANVVEQV